MARASSRIYVALVGLLASGFFVALALRHLDLRQVLALRSEAHPMPWIPLAVGSYLVGHLARGRRLRFLLRRGTFLALPTATNIVVVGYASNNVLPARLGELVRAGMLAERTGIALSESLTITFIERLFDGLAILGLFLLASSTLTDPPAWIPQLARAASAIFGVALALVLVAVFLPGLVLGTASRLASRLPPRWRDRAISLATSVTNAGACLRRPADAVGIAAFSVVVWLFESLMFFFALPIFSLPLKVAPAVMAMSVTNLGILAPSTPGFVGSFHFFCSEAMTSQGVAPPTALAYAIVVHLLFYVPVTLWGAAAMLWYGVQVGATAAMARAAKASPQVTQVQGVPVHAIARLDLPRAAPASASAFYLALTEAMLAPEPGSRDRAAVTGAATFVAQEMDALPSKLRAMLNAGLTGFRFYVRARYLRGFCDLGLDRQRDAVNSWAFGRIALLRQLFRPLRSVALLAYHEAAARPASGLDRRA